jgi:uncharacterized protein (DUF2236 family)
MSEWLFGPDSMMWRINRESVLLLGGRATLLMQIAHPLVAAGVAAHSNFRAEPLRRLKSTLDAMLSIIFGDEDTAREVAAGVNRVHERVVGEAPDGTPYSARDPKLLLWVFATLVESSVRVYEACVAPLSDAERARYYEESKVIAGLFNIPQEHVPATFEALRAWMRSMIEGGEVAVGPLARELAAPILNPLGFVPDRLARIGHLVTPALLPRPIREGYGLKVGRSRAALLALGRGASKAVWPRLPAAVRNWPGRLVTSRPS